jgi:hypothetical protein
MVLTMVYNTQTYWGFGLFPSSTVQWIRLMGPTECLPPLTWGRKYPVSETSCFVLCRTPDAGQVQKPSNSVYLAEFVEEQIYFNFWRFSVTIRDISSLPRKRLTTVTICLLAAECKGNLQLANNFEYSSPIWFSIFFTQFPFSWTL